MADDGMGWIPGLGDNKPQSRLLGKSFFGYVPDAFSMKTPEMPSEKSPQKVSKVSIYSVAGLAVKRVYFYSVIRKHTSVFFKKSIVMCLKVVIVI
jgi:hypothetical protein